MQLKKLVSFIFEQNSGCGNTYLYVIQCETKFADTVLLITCCLLYGTIITITVNIVWTVLFNNLQTFFQKKRVAFCVRILISTFFDCAMICERGYSTVCRLSVCAARPSVPLSVLCNIQVPW